jgi:hypothetical protein
MDDGSRWSCKGWDDGSIGFLGGSVTQAFAACSTLLSTGVTQPGTHATVRTRTLQRIRPTGCCSAAARPGLATGLAIAGDSSNASARARVRLVRGI